MRLRKTKFPHLWPRLSSMDGLRWVSVRVWSPTLEEELEGAVRLDNSPTPWPLFTPQPQIHIEPNTHLESWRSLSTAEGCVWRGSGPDHLGPGWQRQIWTLPKMIWALIFSGDIIKKKSLKRGGFAGAELSVLIPASHQCCTHCLGGGSCPPSLFLSENVGKQMSMWSFYRL